MPIFRYTFKKIITSPSTWIIFALTVAFLASTWSLIRLTLGDEITTYDKNQVLTYYLTYWKSFGFSVLLGIMIFIFIVVKATQIFRDEIDDGTLLILVSKPISRNRIWMEKWLCFQSVIVSYLFFSIFLASIVLVIPTLGSVTIYTTVFPYMWILFGVGFIFDLIISSICLLLSMIINSKALIAIMIGVAALFQIFATVIVSLVNFTPQYYNASQALAVYDNIKKKLPPSELEWLMKEYFSDPQPVSQSIKKNIEDIYTEYIKNITYPGDYDYTAEQTQIEKIATDSTFIPAGTIDKALVKHIYYVGSAFRQWKEQSYEELLTGNHVGPNGDRSYLPGSNSVGYPVVRMLQGFTPLTQKEYDQSNSKITQVRTMRYLNIFYQLYYIWEGISSESGPFNYNYGSNADPYLISFVKDPTGQYQIDTSKPANSKIINYGALVSVYIILGLGLLGASWLIFQRRDFA